MDRIILNNTVQKPKLVLSDEAKDKIVYNIIRKHLNRPTMEESYIDENMSVEFQTIKDNLEYIQQLEEKSKIQSKSEGDRSVSYFNSKNNDYYNLLCDILGVPTPYIQAINIRR